VLISIPTPERADIAPHRDIGAVEVEFRIDSGLLADARAEAEAAGWRFVRARALDDLFLAVTIRKYTPWPE
jgi:hypothetical protein